MTRPRLPATIRTATRYPDGSVVTTTLELVHPDQIGEPHYRITIEAGDLVVRTTARASEAEAIAEHLAAEARRLSTRPAPRTAAEASGG